MSVFAGSKFSAGGWVLLALGSLALGGCERNNSPGRDRGTVTSSRAQTASGECPAGGVNLDYGIDTNGNGTLDADEVDGTHAICHGAPGTTRYAELTDAPDLSVYATVGSLAPVATTGNYQALTDSPDLSVYATVASLAPVATTGSYQALTGAPDLSGYATAASLAAVATTGSYQDLTGAPSESDPKVGALVDGKWCISDGVKLNCDVEPPTIDYSLFDGVTRACPSAGTQTFDGDTAQWSACPSSGFFVLSSTEFDGNLGGLAGADALCLADLQSNDWRGKTGVTLDAEHVKAFLCTTSTCNNLTPNWGYAFAVSGAPAVGGASFVTSAAGTGPHNQDAWNDPTHFGISTAYYSNRGYLSASEWSTTPDPEGPPGGYPEGSLQCGNWTNGTPGLGNWQSIGYTAESQQQRWFANGGHDYCNDSRLICLVNP